jgi:hypothetical protein
MRAWFTNNDRHFMTKNYEDMLKVPELPEDINMFISTIEKVDTFTRIFFWSLFTLYFTRSFLQKVRQGDPEAVYKLCIDKHACSPMNSCIHQISKIYAEL